MDINQLNSIKGFIDNFFSIEIDKRVAEFYKDNENLKSIMIGQFDIITFIDLTKKVFNNFKEVFENDRYKLLPFQYQFSNEFGGGQLNNDLSNLVSHLNANQYPNAHGYIVRLIHYQIINQIWEISAKKEKITKEDTNSLKNELTLISKHIKEYSDKINFLIKDLNAQKEELASFRNQKTIELQEITNSLQTSRAQATEISNLLNSSVSNNEKINSFIVQQTQKFTELETRNQTETTFYKQQKDNFEKLESDLTIQIGQVKEQISSFDEKLKFVEDKKSFFEERNEYLEKLIGREVGASLFETFKQRKLELKAPVNFWKWAVPIMAIATVLWIFFLFKGHTDIKSIQEWWELFAVNTLKSIPAIFLLLFSISQYKKERNFQEEYAFKSVVALTIEAYSNQLNDSKNRDDLIMKSVLEVYKSPIHVKHDDKDDKPSKQILESVKNMSETVKEVIKK